MKGFAAALSRHRGKLIVGAGAALLLLGNKGFRTLVLRAMEIRRLNRELVSLKKEEGALNTQIQQLHKNDYAVEKLVRKELGYIKPGEVEYRFDPPATSCNPADTCSSAPANK